MAEQPLPFEITQLPDGGPRVASNGSARLMLTEQDGELFRRRGITGLSLKPAAEAVLPQLNALAGDLVANTAMPAAELLARLDAIKAGVQTSEPQRIEWAVVKIHDVRVFFDGSTVIVSRSDLRL